MNRFHEEFKRHLSGMDVGELTSFLSCKKLLSETRIQAYVVNQWIDQKLKNPEPKTTIRHSSKSINGRKEMRQHTQESFKGVVDYMWEASEYFSVSYECVRKYRYYYNTLGID